MEPERIIAALQGGLLQVHAHPSKRETAIRGWDGETLEVDVAAPPDKDKANAELLRFLRKFFGKHVELIRGAKSRDKCFRIHIA